MKLQNLIILRRIAKITGALAILTVLIVVPKDITTLTYQKVTHYEPKELTCLMRNIYHEARGESLEGQIAVARVTLNRAAKSSICKVVYAPYQFSWTLVKPKDPSKYPYEIFLAAHLALFTVFPATHYHATYVKPKWASKLTKLKQIDNHVFYI